MFRLRIWDRKKPNCLDYTFYIIIIMQSLFIFEYCKNKITLFRKFHLFFPKVWIYMYFVTHKKWFSITSENLDMQLLNWKSTNISSQKKLQHLAIFGFGRQFSNFCERQISQVVLYCIACEDVLQQPNYSNINAITASLRGINKSLTLLSKACYSCPSLYTCSRKNCP